MNRPRITPPLDAAPKDARTPFHLVVAYEDQPTRDRALHLSHHLSQQLAEDYDFHCSWWKFNHLENAVLREQSVNAAAEANMVVMALHARPDLTALQTDWLGTWLPRRAAGNKAALVAMVGADSPAMVREADLTALRLRHLAKAAHLDFFSHTFDLPKTALEPAGDIPTWAQPAGADAKAALRMPPPRWGINE